MVHRYELLRPLGDVFLLCVKSDGVQSPEASRDADNVPAAAADDHWLCNKLLGASPAEERRGMPHLILQHQTFHCDVLQLFCAFCTVLPQGLPLW